MLHKIRADLAVMKTLAQTAESEVEVGEYSSIAFLNDELIQEGKAARKRIAVSLITMSIEGASYRHCGGDTFEIDAGGVTGGV